MAQLYRRGKTLWIKYYHHGLMYRKSLKLDDNRENRIVARKLAKEITGEIAGGVFVKKINKLNTQRKNLSEGLIDYLNVKKELSESSKRNYSQAVDQFIKVIGDLRIGEVTPFRTETFEDELKRRRKNTRGGPVRLSENTIENYFRHLRILYSYFIRQGYVTENPFPKKKMVEREVKIIPKEEISKIINGLKEHNREHYRLIQFLLLTGLRISEALNMSFADIDFQRNVIYVKNTKGKRQDVFPLYKVLREFILTEWETENLTEKNKSVKLFSFKNKDSLKFFRRFLERENLPLYSFHTIRKTFLSMLVNSGMNLFDVMTLGRHKNVNITKQFYLRAEIDRIGTSVNDVVKIGTILGTISENPLKIAQK